MRPLKVKQVNGSELTIEWDDMHKGSHVLRTLRKYCPCAGCKQEVEMGEGSVMLPIVKPGQFVLKGIEAVGNYALQLTWGDGHRTGIYTYDHLRQICECQECVKKTAE
ncbi:MAG TPA: DUF971 domain-containing protein [Bacteroidota bacterium]|nr:DUF971 domain-containing protein [Bacteroidota bacterium]